MATTALTGYVLEIAHTTFSGCNDSHERVVLRRLNGSLRAIKKIAKEWLEKHDVGGRYHSATVYQFVNGVVKYVFDVEIDWGNDEDDDDPVMVLEDLRKKCAAEGREPTEVECARAVCRKPVLSLTWKKARVD